MQYLVLGVARGGTWAMVTKIYKYHMCPPFCQILKKFVLRFSKHGDVIETQTIKVCPPIFLANSVPVYAIIDNVIGGLIVRCNAVKRI